MSRVFDYEVFYDFLEVIHELKFFFEGVAEIDPFNYLDSYLLIRRCADEGANSTEAERLLYDALCHTDSKDPVFNGARSGRTTDILEDILIFIDAIDIWRLTISKHYGITPVLTDKRAFCLLCETYCDENEPAYSMIYHQEKLKLDRQQPVKTQRQLKDDIHRLRSAHFTQPTPNNRSIQELDESIKNARKRLDAWYIKNPNLDEKSSFFKLNEMAKIMLEKNVLKD